MLTYVIKSATHCDAPDAPEPFICPGRNIITHVVVGMCAVQSADDACERVAGRMHDLEAEIRQLRARHTEQIKQMQHQQAR